MTEKQKSIVLLLFYIAFIALVFVGVWDTAPEIKYTINWLKEIWK
jgi:FtsZ-interacting cell division protein ZipA